MNTNTHATFLKEMGITQWTSRDVVSTETADYAQSTNLEHIQEVTAARAPLGMWWFIGSKPQGDAELLMQSIVRSLGLSAQEWTWINPNELLDPKVLAKDDIPIVAITFGSSAAQKLSGERDPLPQLRQTILAFNQEGFEELPLIATFELNHLLSKPKDKALLWQDLLLAKSVLQNS